MAPVIVFVVAGTLEAIQMLELTRHGRLIDAVEKIGGGWIGVGAAFVLAKALTILSRERIVAEPVGSRGSFQESNLDERP